MHSVKTALKLIAAALASCALLFVVFVVVCQIEYKRAATLLGELRRIQLEQPEPSLAPLIERFNGKLAERERGPEDRTFVMRVDPWRLLRPVPGPEWLDRTYRWTFSETGNWRRTLKLRSWVATGWIRTTNGTVGVVSGSLVIEGENEWLMAEWRYGAAIPEERRHRSPDEANLPRALSELDASWSHLHFGNGTGEAVFTSVTPKSSAEQLNAARHIDFTCLTRGKGCPSLCTLLPDIDRYRRANSLLGAWGWNSGSWGQQPPDCR